MEAVAAFASGPVSSETAAALAITKLIDAMELTTNSRDQPNDKCRLSSQRNRSPRRSRPIASPRKDLESMQFQTCPDEQGIKTKADPTPYPFSSVPNVP